MIQNVHCPFKNISLGGTKLIIFTGAMDSFVVLACILGWSLVWLIGTYRTFNLCVMTEGILVDVLFLVLIVL